MESSVSILNKGCMLGKAQLILEKSGISNLNVEERNSITSSTDLGSRAPKSFHGNAKIFKPLGRYNISSKRIDSY